MNGPDAVAEALTSLRAEGIVPSRVGLELLLGVSMGVLTADEAVAQLIEYHQIRKETQ